MKQEEGQDNPLAPVVLKLTTIIAVLIIFIIVLLFLLGIYVPAASPKKAER